MTLATARPRPRPAAPLVALALVVGCNPSVPPPPTGAAAAGSKEVYVLHFEGPGDAVDPDNRAIRDGLKAQGLAEKSGYALVGRRAGGDPEKLAALVDEAIAAKPGAIITLDPRSTLLAVEKAGTIPVIFGMAADPMAMGLGENIRDHRANVTGAYVAFETAMLLPIVRGSVKEAKAIGIAFNPDDPASVGHKDSLVQSDPRATVVTAEVRSADEATAAIQSLVDQGAGALVLATGLGEAERAMMEAAAGAKLPAFGFTESVVRSGGLLARVPDARFLGFEAGRRAGRVLQGESPEEMKFAPGSGFTTYFDPEAAAAMGVTLLGDVLRDARKIDSDETVVGGATAPN